MATNKHKPLLPLSDKDLERYWTKVEKLGPNDCWPWLPMKAKGNHGRFGIGGRKGGNVLAHRVAYFIATGHDPGSNKCCHSCDWPPCQNPAHLFPGTQADNIADMIKKGRKRQVRGETHPRTRLTWKQVMEIRRLYKPSTRGVKNGSFALAERFGIHPHHLLGIATWKAWKNRN